ncbi:MAG: hypothetical protein ACJAZN_000278 [Planctomycetota bacterium]|jgi:hypothetical protein
MLQKLMSKPALFLALALSAISCRGHSTPRLQALEEDPARSHAAGPSDHEEARPTAEAEATKAAPKAAAVVFQLALGRTSSVCSAPILHGLDPSGAKIWSKAFLDGEVGCTQSETDGLAQVRIEHPYLALRQGLRFSTPPSGLVRIDPVFFGDCLVQLTGLAQSDLQAHLVIRNLDRESYRDAVFHGRSEILDGLEDLRFERLPIGRYIVALFREDPFGSPGEPYRHRTVSILPCQESAIELAGDAEPKVAPGRSGKQR